MNSYTTLICLLCFSGASLFAQIKGAQPVDDFESAFITTNTYALVVGISDYQDENISDLRFADDDAVALSNYFKSKSGGSLDKDHLVLLTNDSATLANVTASLDWLKSVSKAGDRVIIYFSGHGDIEAVHQDEMGFLLCYDASARVYNAGGALPLSVLQFAIFTLSTQNLAKVILITDACHSGALAGSSVGGPRITAEYLQAMDNEIKILSCQPNEFSIEGEQWGGGRGVFSYHLLDGLQGLADDNRDALISLQELGWYLEKNVSQDVAPVKQVPLIMGERHEKLALVSISSSDSLYFTKKNIALTLNKIESRSEELVISSLDTLVQYYYKMFNYCLKNKLLLTPIIKADSTYAEYYYQKLIQQKELKPIYASIRRNYATALQNDAQQVINALLKIDIHEISRSKISKSTDYRKYPAYLLRAAQLLGSNNQFYNRLLAREKLIQGITQLWDISGQRDKLKAAQIMQIFRESLLLEPNAPHTYFYMMYCQASQFENRDSSIFYAEKALSYAPKWILPYTYLAYFFSNKFHDATTAWKYLQKAIDLDQLNPMVAFATASWHYYNGDIIKADSLYQIISVENPTNSIALLNLGIVNLKLERYAEAKSYLNHYLILDSMGFQGYHYLAIAYQMSGDEILAEQYFKKSIKLDSNYIYSKRELARLYRKHKKNEEAEALYRILLTFDFDNKAVIYYEMACLSSLNNQIPESVNYLKQALEAGFKNIEQFYFNQELRNASQDPEFKKLLENYKK